MVKLFTWKILRMILWCWWHPSIQMFRWCLDMFSKELALFRWFDAWLWSTRSLPGWMPRWRRRRSICQPDVKREARQTGRLPDVCCRLMGYHCLMLFEGTLGQFHPSYWHFLCKLLFWHVFAVFCIFMWFLHSFWAWWPDFTRTFALAPAMAS